MAEERGVDGGVLDDGKPRVGEEDADDYARDHREVESKLATEDALDDPECDYGAKDQERDREHAVVDRDQGDEVGLGGIAEGVHEIAYAPERVVDRPLGDRLHDLSRAAGVGIGGRVHEKSRPA